MSEERLHFVPQTEALIESDLKTGGHSTFDFVLSELKTRGNIEEDIFELAGTNRLLIDLGTDLDLGVLKNIFQINIFPVDFNINSIKHEGIFRLIIEKSTKGNQPYFSLQIWPVDGSRKVMFQGHKIETLGNSTKISREDYDSYYLYDSSPVNPREFAAYLDAAIGVVNPYKWQLFRGLRNVPGGTL